jgi:8-oxo-dGTP pyrophosphatase MutT (NUDIX family)
MPREKSAGAIVFYNENGVPHYLLLHYPSKNRKGGHWEFPKGHVEAGESEEQTMKREVKEETGLYDLKVMPGFKKYIKYFFRQYSNKNIKPKGQKTPWIFKLVTFFIAETQTKRIQLSHEHTGYEWLPIDEAIKKTTFKNSKKLLKEADNFITK